MTFELILIASLVIALSYWLEENIGWFLHVSNTVFIIVFACILANSGIISSSEQSYNEVFKWCVPLGIILMLMAFNPKQIFEVKKEFLVCFGVGAIGSVIGGIVAGLLFANIIPETYWKVSGQLTASYIGGYENAIATGTVLQMPTELFIQVIAADSVLTVLWIICTIYLGRMPINAAQTKYRDDAANKFLGGNTDITSTSMAIALALLILFIVDLITSFFPGYSNSKIILASLFATLVAFTPLSNRLSGAYIFGSILLSVFFFACGAISNVVMLFQNLSVLIFFPATIVIVHALILFGFAKFFNIQKDIVSVSSQALIGGPATALAVVMALKLPYRFEAVALGLFGYVIANYIGVGTALLVRAL